MPSYFTNELLQKILTDINNSYQMGLENQKKIEQMAEDIKKIEENLGMIEKVM